MHLVHIGSDYRQLLWVLLGHPHPRKVALSSTRVLSMQGFALLNGSLAGRFIHQSIHPPPSISPLDQPISDCAGGLPAVGWTPIINRLVKRLVGRHFDGGSRNRFANCGQLSLLKTFRKVLLLPWSLQVCLGQTLFLVRHIWGCSSPEPQRLLLGKYPYLCNWGCTFCLATHKNLRWTLCFCLSGSGLSIGMCLNEEPG